MLTKRPLVRNYHQVKTRKYRRKIQENTRISNVIKQRIANICRYKPFCKEAYYPHLVSVIFFTKILNRPLSPSRYILITTFLYREFFQNIKHEFHHSVKIIPRHEEAAVSNHMCRMQEMVRIWIILAVLFIKDVNNTFYILFSVTGRILVDNRRTKIEYSINLAFISIWKPFNSKLSSVVVEAYVIRCFSIFPYVIHCNHF